ncbi:hypothetical protein FKM82_002941 [Ascaphus truei]
MACQTGKVLYLERNCVLCCQELEVFAVGKCDHPICFRCSTKMRVLCEQRYCAVCREELDKVVFLKKIALFSSIDTHKLQHEKKYDIYFSDGTVFSQYRCLLQHECTKCPELRPFHTFVDLEQHMRKQHELFCCKLCVKHLKNFTYERTWYTRKDLARHRIHGDPEDTSHRGHPLCKFCDERYLDNDELLKHLRRDHYFCHFCDTEGAQEYYSDYDFLREHFRESHYLCEEGRCSTEQFTHAFRTEIDYKAHKTTCHSKNRAEARQNRQIDLQFNYASRHNRRHEGTVGGEDYEEVDRYNRQGRMVRGAGRGGQQNKRGSWRYKREEEDREVAAAVRASVAARRQEEMGRKHMQEIPEGAKSRKEEARDPEDGRRFKAAAPKLTGDTTGPKETGRMLSAANGALNPEDFPAFGSELFGPVPAAPLLSTAKPIPAKLKEEDFPSLSAAVSSTSSSSSSTVFSTGLSYTTSARSTNAFQEEDFPALVSKIKQSTPLSAVTSTWATSSSKSTVRPAAPKMAAPSKAVKKATPQGSGKWVTKKVAKTSSLSEDDEDDGGMTTQEFRNAPTMFDISTLLTAPSQTSGKVSKKKRMGSEKQSSFSNQAAEDRRANSSLKENATERECVPLPPASSILGDKSNTVANGLTEWKVAEKSSASKDPPGLRKTAAPQYSLPEEEFPALGNSSNLRMPPPGFSPFVAVTARTPPPGLSSPVGKPPPGFSNVPPAPPPEPITKPVREPSFTTRTYLVPENFQQRNIHLINSIKDFLHSDESRFNEFKSHSGKFRQEETAGPVNPSFSCSFPPTKKYLDPMQVIEGRRQYLTTFSYQNKLFFPVFACVEGSNTNVQFGIGWFQ